ncbi:phage tail tape measure protein [Citrobacter freundii complex sp. CFNIH2]|uniref:phage tail tape measure protein n=1 Tax=Citrobacter freundii complex sp. CFNIH2 TaxID=2066049 RepID=UPI000C869903|nr:phage tail tape measure protein [Citrobacter freundii complex sp. CFNIH2]AUO64112.1 phage tail tape measure protein [Citrobacter freundii complex sp. CFNIH2]
MSDIATITLKVNTSELEKGNQELDKFQATAAGAAHKADDLNSAFRAGTQSGKQHNQSLKEQQQELQNLLNRINPTNKAFEELDKIYAQLAQANKKGLLPTDQFRDYGAILDDTRNKLQRTQLSLTEEGRALLDQEGATRRAAQAGESFVTSLQEQASVVGKTRSEILEMKAAQLGVADQSAPFIAKLREQENAWKRGEISAGQYRMAMRQLPMQITDVVTSLASGMPVYMVAIQQGGQIRDSFGGIGNALKAVTSLITPARLAVGGLAGGMLLATKAGIDYFDTLEQINFALIRTGNLANTTASDVMVSAQSISSETGTSISTVTELMTKLIDTGAMTGEQLDKAAKSTALAVQTGLVSADDMVKAYKDIEKDPVKALQSLNEKYNFLTLSQLKSIDQLVKQKKETEAVTKAMDIFGATMDQRGEQAYNALSPFGRLWLDVKSWALDTMNSIGQWVAELTVNTIKEFNAIYYSVATVFQKLNQIISQSIASAIDLIPEWAKTDTLQGWQDYNQGMADAYAKSVTDLGKEWDKANKSADDYLKTASKTGAAITQKDREEVAAYSSKNKTGKGYSVPSGDRAEESAQGELLALQAQLKVLQQHKDVNDKISQQRKELWETEAKFQVLDEAARTRQLSKQERSLLSSKNQVLALARQKAELGDQIVVQEKLNSLMDNALKLRRQQEAKRAEVAMLATGASSRDSQRESETNRIREEYSLNPAAQAKALAEMRKTYEAQDELEQNWRAGAINGLNEYLQTAQNVYSSVSQAAQTALGGISDMMTSLVTTGTASFKQFAASILKMIVEIINRLLVAYAVQAAMGWITGSASGGGNTPSGAYTSAAANVGFDSGGYTGDGGKYEPKGVVHGGEFVFTKEATSALGVGNLYALMRNAQGYADGGFVGRAPMYGLNSGSGAGGSAPVINTIVNVEANGNASAQTSSSGDAMGRALADEMQNAATMVVQKHLKPGGMIYNFSKGL